MHELQDNIDRARGGEEMQFDESEGEGADHEAGHPMLQALVDGQGGGVASAGNGNPAPVHAGAEIGVGDEGDGAIDMAAPVQPVEGAGVEAVVDAGAGDAPAPHAGADVDGPEAEAAIGNGAAVGPLAPVDAADIMQAEHRKWTANWYRDHKHEPIAPGADTSVLTAAFSHLSLLVKGRIHTTIFDDLCHLNYKQHGGACDENLFPPCVALAPRCLFPIMMCSCDNIVGLSGTEVSQRHESRNLPAFRKVSLGLVT
jgi:hypothetical protein